MGIMRMSSIISSLIKHNRILATAFPAHTSHELQPLDVSGFGAYKSYLQAELHRYALANATLNAFSVASCIHRTYSKSFVRPKIQADFSKCGLWSEGRNRPDINALSAPFKVGDDVAVEKPIFAFNKSQRSILRDADVEEKGRVRISTANGAHLTSKLVLQALKKREENEHKTREGELKAEHKVRVPQRGLSRQLQGGDMPPLLMSALKKESA